MKIKGIYKIVNCINNKVYIGQSIDIEKRFNDHKYNSDNNIQHPLYNSIRKYTINNFDFLILDEVADINKLDECEQFWMDYYNSYNPEYGYNLSPTSGGSTRGIKLKEEHKRKISLGNIGKKISEESINKRLKTMKGYKHSDRTLEKMSKSLKGKAAWNKGLKMSKEFCINLSRANKGKNKPPFTEEHRKNLSLASKGKPKSEEARKNMSLSQKGKPSTRKGQKCSEEHRKNIGLASKINWQNPEFAKNHSAKIKSNWADPIKRQAMLLSRKEKIIK